MLNFYNQKLNPFKIYFVFKRPDLRIAKNKISQARSSKNQATTPPAKYKTIFASPHACTTKHSSLSTLKRTPHKFKEQKSNYSLFLQNRKNHTSIGLVSVFTQQLIISILSYIPTNTT